MGLRRSGFVPLAKAEALRRVGDLPPLRSAWARSDLESCGLPQIHGQARGLQMIWCQYSKFAHGCSAPITVEMSAWPATLTHGPIALPATMDCEAVFPVSRLAMIRLPTS
jgi:hypothetical protein